MAETAALEMRYSLSAIGGSNPSLSANAVRGSAPEAHPPPAENPPPPHHLNDLTMLLAGMFWVYALWSQKLNKRYVGSTQNLEKRLREHNAGKTPFTHRGIPWILIHRESYDTLHEARQRERFLKSGAGRKWLDQNVKIPEVGRILS
jgi:putative endonuclease